MKPLKFVCYARPKNNRAAYLKCDRATRARMNSYLFRLYDALGRAESDPFAAEDRALVADLINMQLQGRDWSENDLMMFQSRWMRGKRNRLVFEITEAQRGDNARYDDLRRINVAAIVQGAAAEYGLLWDVSGEVVESTEAVSQSEASQLSQVLEVVDAMALHMERMQAEIDRLSAAQSKPINPVESEIVVDRKRLAERINARSAARSQAASQPAPQGGRPAQPQVSPCGYEWQRCVQRLSWFASSIPHSYLFKKEGRGDQHHAPF